MTHALVGVVGTGLAVVLTLLAWMVARSTVGAPQRVRALTNAENEDPASVAGAQRFFDQNSRVLTSCATIAVFIIITWVRPLSYLPAHDDVTTFSAGGYTGTLATNTGPRHVEEGDTFEVDMSISAPHNGRSNCSISPLSTTAVAPGAEIAPIKPLVVSSTTCVGTSSWLIGTRKKGRVIVAVTVSDSRPHPPFQSPLAAATVGLDVEKSTDLSDALVGAIAGLLAALITTIGATKKHE